MEQGQFIELVSDFVRDARIESVSQIPDDLDHVSFTSDEVTCSIYPHPQEDVLILEADVSRLEPFDPRDGFRAAMALHELNFAARLRTGMVASISPENLLVLSKNYPAAKLTGQRLAEEVVRIVDAATHFRQTWNSILESGSSVPVSAESSELDMLNRI